MSEAFDSAQQRRVFVQLCISTFLLFTTGSTLAMLSIALEKSGHDAREIGIVLASPMAPVIVAILMAGKILRRFDALKVALLGQALMVGSFAAFDLAISSTLGAALCRATFGLGFGVYFAASTFAARDMLKGPRTVYLFGVFGSMITLPNVIGPALAEFVLSHGGLHGYFLWLSLPGVLALAILARMCLSYRVTQPIASSAPLPYWSFYGARAFRQASMTNFFVGVLWGMAFGYVALHLVRHGIFAAAFFSSMTAAFFATRFVLMAWLQRRPREKAVAGSFACMAVAFCLLGAVPSMATAALSGLVFGLGYSSVLPILGVWASDVFPPSNRSMAMAFFNAHFHVGFFAFPIAVGSVAALQRLDLTLELLGALSALAAAWYWTKAYDAQVRAAHPPAL